MSSSNKILNFSLGPVQSFIARARKTRDFWTGSFLLSYLAGQAMAVVLKENGRLILPAAAENEGDDNDPLLQAIIDNKTNGKTITKIPERPPIATLPNRFRAEVPSGFDPALCEQAIRNEWFKITALIWKRYLKEPAAQGKGTREIWERQINNFWEINWIISADSAALDLRKNWRNHIPSVEHGDKCNLFGDLQELSGYLRINERENQDLFWKTLQQQNRAGVFYDLGEDERLCSIALIKRFFPYISEEIIFKVSPKYPSTPYLAAVNWIAQVIKKKAEGAKRFAEKASPSLLEAGDREDPDIFPIIAENLKLCPQAKKFASLDGNCFFKQALENPNVWGKPPAQARETEILREELVGMLEELGKPCSPFYAMLLMDGDLLGALLQQYEDNPEEISKSLHRFSLQAPLTIKNNNGITVFAGGDDMLALVPLENALSAAVELCSFYQKAFEKNKITDATISGAIVYAHYNTPLTEVYAEAQQLLANVAKTKTGRDSLAVTVWKSAGKVLTWSAPWKIVTDQFCGFLKSFRKDLLGEDTYKEFSSSFFYNVQTRFALFAKQETATALSLSDLRDLLVAEYIKSRGPNTDRAKARSLMEKLLELCKPHWRNQDGEIRNDKHQLQLDSLFLIKFLSEKGVEQ